MSRMSSNSYWGKELITGTLEKNIGYNPYGCQQEYSAILKIISGRGKAPIGPSGRPVAVAR